MAGLSEHAHDLILKSAPKKKVGTLGERELTRNRARLFAQEKARAERALRTRGGSVGSGWAKLDGVGQEAPHGSELGSVSRARRRPARRRGARPAAREDAAAQIPPAAEQRAEQQRGPPAPGTPQVPPAPLRFRNRD